MFPENLIIQNRDPVDESEILYTTFIERTTIRFRLGIGLLSPEGRRAILIRCSGLFMGCFFFIYLGSLSAISVIDSHDPLNLALVHGMCVTVLITSLGHICGGHYNPAITVGVLISGEIHIKIAILDWTSQLSGGFVGALMLRATTSDEIYLAISGGTTNINLDNVTVPEAIGLDAALAFLLAFTVLNASINSEGTNLLAPLGIGMSLALNILAGYSSIGGSFNTGRSFGPALCYQIFENCNNQTGCMTAAAVWKYHYVHWVGPTIGGITAGILYKSLFAKPEKRWFFNTAVKNTKSQFNDSKYILKNRKI